MWQPIADSETSRRCWSAVEDIERALAGPEAEGSPGLAGGKAGQALFFAYLDAARPGNGAGDLALETLGQSIEALGERPLIASLYSGFSGIGWTAEHLSRRFFESEDDDLCSDLDTALSALVSAPADRTQYELINGLAGYGVYLLERLPRPGAAEILVRILDRLEATAEESEAGLTWHTSPDWLPDWQRERMPGGCYNLGVAHGVAGVAGFLAAARRHGVADPRIPRLADGAVRWLLAQRLPPDGESAFPGMVVPEQAPRPTRTAWCYGDAGLAAVLLSAAHAFDRPDWGEEALALARLAARRSTEEAGTVDAGLCHGTAGLGHLFNRIHQATGDPEIREAALAWLGRALDMRRPGEGRAGYLFYLASGPGANTWDGDDGLLQGITGVGLALLAAVSDLAPDWDRILLVSVPPSQPAQDTTAP